MAYSEQVKKEAIEKIQAGATVKKIAEEMKISPATLYRWKKELQNMQVSREVEQEQNK